MRALLVLATAAATEMMFELVPPFTRSEVCEAQFECYDDAASSEIRFRRDGMDFYGADPSIAFARNVSASELTIETVFEITPSFSLNGPPVVLEVERKQFVRLSTGTKSITVSWTADDQNNGGPTIQGPNTETSLDCSPAIGTFEVLVHVSAATTDVLVSQSCLLSLDVGLLDLDDEPVNVDFGAVEHVKYHSIAACLADRCGLVDLRCPDADSDDCVCPTGYRKRDMCMLPPPGHQSAPCLHIDRDILNYEARLLDCVKMPSTQDDDAICQSRKTLDCLCPATMRARDLCVPVTSTCLSVQNKLDALRAARAAGDCLP